MKKIIGLLVAVLIGTSCNKLDILPQSIIQDKDVFASASGVTAYMAGLYNRLPIEDFKFNTTDGDGYNNFAFISAPHNNTGEGMNKNINGVNRGALGYWDLGFTAVRGANYAIEQMPAIAKAAGLSEAQVNSWLGECYFIRAFTYFEFAKRYGGMPILKTAQRYPDQSIEELQLSRSSEQETFDFIAEDCDQAINLLGAASEQKGRANKYIAAGLKSRAMLFAGSIAKYNTKNTVDPKTNKRVQGIPLGEAVRYFKLCYEASKLVETGGYALYRPTGNKMANFTNVFFDVTTANKEMMLYRQYSRNNAAHSYDVFAVPRQLTGRDGYTSYVLPTLDFVELFDGLPKNADGSIKTTDDNGNYIMYGGNHGYDLFKNAEPRLLATVNFPGTVFKGQSLDIRRGIFTGAVGTGIAKFPTPPFGTQTDYTKIPGLMASTSNDGKPEVTVGAQKILAGGLSGMYGASGNAGTYSGFNIRKMVDETKPTAEVYVNNSVQPWPEMRYAEILLNCAEAAYELQLAGQNDVNYVHDAFVAINDIRDRAGAILLAGDANVNLDVIRKERRKELSFENKIWWDVRRWRTADTEINNRLWFILCPILVAENGSYIFDRRTDERTGSRFTFNPTWYYDGIPGGEITKNPNLYQNQ